MGVDDKEIRQLGGGLGEETPDLWTAEGDIVVRKGFREIVEFHDEPGATARLVHRVPRGRYVLSVDRR